MAHQRKHVRGKHVSSWLEEHGCGVVFSRDEESDDEYLLIQRHFEEPEDDRPYVETDDEDFCGHFRIAAATLDRDHLEIRYASKTVEVTFATSEERFQQLTKILPILAPKVRIGQRPG